MNNKGFSILELMVAVMVSLIIISWITKSYKSTVEQKKLQTETDKLYAEFHSIRAIGFKEDAGVLIKFVSSQCCSIYLDTNSKAPPSPYKKITIPNNVEIGVASNGPHIAPDGQEWGDDGISPGWKSGLIINHSPIGEINTGAIYLRNTKLDEFTYCIGVSSNMLIFDMYKWDGNKWINCKN